MDTSSLLDFCTERRGPSRAFHVPLLNVYEVGRLITGLKSKKCMGPDDIPARLLKFAFPLIVKLLTYIYSLCIQKSVLPEMFKTAKVTPLPKNCLLVGCLTSQQHASVSQGRICSDNFTCCHTETEVADQTPKEY